MARYYFFVIALLGSEHALSQPQLFECSIDDDSFLSFDLADDELELLHLDTAQGQPLYIQGLESVNAVHLYDADQSFKEDLSSYFDYVSEAVNSYSTPDFVEIVLSLNTQTCDDCFILFRSTFGDEDMCLYTTIFPEDTVGGIQVGNAIGQTPENPEPLSNLDQSFNSTAGGCSLLASKDKGHFYGLLFILTIFLLLSLSLAQVSREERSES